MTTTKARSQSGTAKWGWGTLLVLSALLVLGSAFLFSLEGSLSAFEQETGVSPSEFRQAYPTVANRLVWEGQTLWILLAGFGLLALVASLEGFRHGSRWAWNALWVLVGLLAVVGVHALVGGKSFGPSWLFAAVVALVGQLLARRGAGTGK